MFETMFAFVICLCYKVHMMTREKWLEGFAVRRAKIIALRAQDKKLWTLRRLGKKFRLSPERIRQLLKDNDGTESNTDLKT